VSPSLIGFAQYNFSFNNFLGSGNFNTTGNVFASNFVGNLNYSWLQNDPNNITTFTPRNKTTDKNGSLIIYNKNGTQQYNETNGYFNNWTKFYDMPGLLPLNTFFVGFNVSNQNEMMFARYMPQINVSQKIIVNGTGFCNYNGVCWSAEEFNTSNFVGENYSFKILNVTNQLTINGSIKQVGGGEFNISNITQINTNNLSATAFLLGKIDSNSTRFSADNASQNTYLKNFIDTNSTTIMNAINANSTKFNLNNDSVTGFVRVNYVATAGGNITGNLNLTNVANITNPNRYCINAACTSYIWFNSSSQFTQWIT
jgi:hypothetical protein